MNIQSLFTSPSSSANRIQPDNRTLNRGAQREVDTGPPDGPPRKPTLSSREVTRHEPIARGKELDSADTNKELAAAFVPFVQRIAPELNSIDSSELARLIEGVFNKAGLDADSLTQLTSVDRGSFAEIAQRIANLLLSKMQPQGGDPRYMPGLTGFPDEPANGQRTPTLNSGGNFMTLPGNGTPIEVENPSVTNTAAFSLSAFGKKADIQLSSQSQAAPTLSASGSITTIPAQGGTISIDQADIAALSDEVVKVIAKSTDARPKTDASMDQLLMSKRPIAASTTTARPQPILADSASSDEVIEGGIASTLMGARPKPVPNSLANSGQGSPNFGQNPAATSLSSFAPIGDADDAEWWTNLESGTKGDRTLETGNTLPGAKTSLSDAVNPTIGFGASADVSVDNFAKITDAAAQRIRASVEAAIQDLIEARRGGSVTLRLDPKELGAIVLKIDQNRDEVKVRAEASNDAVKALLTENRIELSRALLEKGFNLQNFDVGSDQANFDRDSQQAERDRNVSSTMSKSARTAGEPQTSSASYSIGNGGIDYIA